MDVKQGKPRYGLLPWRGLRWVVRVLEYGARKYTSWGWKAVPGGAEVYREALYRHTAAIAEGEFWDPESKLPHFAHVACNALILLELDPPEQHEKAA